MASFAAQAALRSKWTDLVEEHTMDVEVTNKFTSVVGWLKQASLEVRAASRRAVSTLASGTDPKMPTSCAHEQLVIIHFNDVYNVEGRANREPVGGAAKFLTAVNSFKHLNPLVLFSGDAFSPSILSTFTKGEQMVPVLNSVGTHCAVFGNHDFDFGLEILSQWVSKCNFPWLMSNVIDNETGRPLGDGRITNVFNWNGKQIGVVGLVEKEWLDTLATINPDEVTFLDFVDAGTKLSEQLKQEGCDYVIALTHMRTPNDIRLAENCAGVDLILGGHDHVYEVHRVNDKLIVKSGTDFRQFSKITVDFATRADDARPCVTVDEVNVTSQYEDDAALKLVLDKYTSVVEAKMDDVLGVFSVALDGRFSAVRTSETNLGNWICDVILASTNADLVILNSGTFRSDQVHPPGQFKMRDLVNIVPMQDPVVVLSVSGETLLKVLENGVSMYPKLEGRFPQVAGLSFAFDPRAAPGCRVDARLVRIGDEYLDPAQMYKLATKSYLKTGCDGYTMLKDATVLVGEDECFNIQLAIQNHFEAIKVRTGKSRKPSKHRQSLVTLSRRHSLVKNLDSFDFDGPSPIRRSSLIDATNHHHAMKRGNSDAGNAHAPLSPALGGVNTHHKLMRRASLEDLEHQSCQLSPTNENRILIIRSDDERQQLLLHKQRTQQDSVIAEVDDESNSDPNTPDGVK